MSAPIESAFREMVLGSRSVGQILGRRLSPHSVGQGKIRPYGTYTRIAGIPERHLGGASGLVFTRIQLDLYADDVDQLYALAEAVRVRADGFSGYVEVTSGATIYLQNVELIDTSSGYESPNDGSDAGPHRYRMDFRISAPESIPSLT